MRNGLRQGVSDGMDKISRIFLQAAAAGLEGEVMENPDLSVEEWRKLMDLSEKQMLLPVVFEAVYASMPEDLEQEYRAAALTLISSQTRNTDTFLKLYSRLKELGIEPLVFKGLVCRDAYRLPDWRVSGDEDIYISRDQYGRFHTIMKEMGFRASDPNYHSEHETLYRGSGLRIEGHWELFPRENRLWEQMNSQTEGILKRALHRQIEGTEVLVMEPTDHMIYMLLHAMKHFTLSGVGIRQICDIVQWDQRYEIDWQRVGEAMRSPGGTRFTEAILDAGNRFFGMKIPDGWNTTDASDLIEDALTGGVFGQSTQERLHSGSITAADGRGRNPAGSLLRTLFPAREVMEINYPWVSRNRVLLPVGWGARILRYIGSIGKNNSPIRSLQIGRQRMELLKEYDVFQERTGTDADQDKS